MRKLVVFLHKWIIYVRLTSCLYLDYPSKKMFNLIWKMKWSEPTHDDQVLQVINIELTELISDLRLGNLKNSQNGSSTRLPQTIFVDEPLAYRRLEEDPEVVEWLSKETTFKHLGHYTIIRGIAEQSDYALDIKSILILLFYMSLETTHTRIVFDGLIERLLEGTVITESKELVNFKCRLAYLEHVYG